MAIDVEQDLSETQLVGLGELIRLADSIKPAPYTSGGEPAVLIPCEVARALLAEVVRRRAAAVHPAECRRCLSAWADCFCMGGPRA